MRYSIRACLFAVLLVTGGPVGWAASDPALATFSLSGAPRTITRGDLDFLIETHPELRAAQGNPDAERRLARELVLDALVASGQSSAPAVPAAFESLVKLRYADAVAKSELLHGPYWGRFKNQRELVARVSHILIYIPGHEQDQPANQRRKAYAQGLQRAKSVMAEIRAGKKSFAAAATAYSGSISKYNAGYLGYIAVHHFDRVDPAFVRAVAEAPLNTLAGPYRSARIRGYHILKVRDRKRLTLDQIKRLPEVVKQGGQAAAQVEQLYLARLHDQLTAKWVASGKHAYPGAERMRELYGAEKTSVEAAGRGNVGPFEQFAGQVRDQMVWFWEASSRGLLKEPAYARFRALEYRRLEKDLRAGAVAAKAATVTEQEIRDRYLFGNSDKPYEQVRGKIRRSLAREKARHAVHAWREDLLRQAGFRWLGGAEGNGRAH